ncbi:hypothetical protein B0A49_08044 [Cryomyces minteri]|uniref:Dynamin N-terminal domain-containing protein n=1 Tax=Cryomyces minteri TaxID=331657 RepID=A0A4U0WTJ5_9PEZI|nr:hypothetical protein B0A49_08044 [Cryomyces minteri]
MHRSVNAETGYAVENTNGPSTPGSAEASSKEHIKKLKQFKRELRVSKRELRRGLLDVIVQANKIIFPSERPLRGFSKHILSIASCGPTKRPLQLVDLPGLIAYDNDGSGENKISLIRNLVIAQISKPQSTVLAVVRATDDINNNEILQHCAKYANKDRRTLGVITMPDLAPSEEANVYVKILKNGPTDFKFEHDWHVLKNRTHGEDTTSRKRNEAARQFFMESQVWCTVPAKNRGIFALRDRLRTILFSVAKRELPVLRNMIKERVAILGKEFQDLGRRT